jgi:DNA-binding NtrC family response regulator
MRILVVDDEKIKRVTLADDLASQGHDVVTAADGQEALDRMRQTPVDVVVTDLKMPTMDGIELLKRIKGGAVPDAAVIMMSAYGSIPVAVEAVKLGAFDFITKPFRNEELLPLISRIERRQAANGNNGSGARPDPQDIERVVIGQSVGMRKVRRMITIAARTDANVLLVGETGCGKDLIASVIHRNSHRHRFPLAKVGCALFSPQLIESELYGHEKGSFTGADQRRKGRFELAAGGTLYLDDADDIPLEQQAKLLRAIEEKVYERVGGIDLIEADVRVIASTKRNLLEKIAEGTFREDLYYRLDVLRIRIPPLRERREDIPALTEHLLARIAEDRDYEFEPAASEVLQQHNWPGNVRELYHALERALLVGNNHITADLLRAETGGLAAPPSEPEVMARDDFSLPKGGFQAAVERAERQLLTNALKACNGNKTAAAAALGMKPSTFRDKLNKYGLN